MNITLQEQGRLKVEMTFSDLSRYGLTYEQLDYSNQKTRQMLQSVLNGAGSMVGFSGETSKMLIEVFPAPAGGCIIYFSGMSGEPAAGSKLRLRRQKKDPLVFDFETSEQMLSALEKLYGLNEVVESELYELSGKYRLIIWGPFKKNESRAILNEYSAFAVAPELAVAYTSEHGRLLATGNTVEQVGRLMSGL